jgi:nicotinic acid mononucleotide adenylyltransferase
VIGTDILGETAKWHRWDDVVKAAPPIIVGRAGHLPVGSSATGVAMPAISSTEIRAQLAAGHPEAVAALVPASVLWYIAGRNLYSAP